MLNHLRHWKNLRRISEAVFLLLCVCAGTALRLSFASNEPLWVDEAASSINALSILEHAYPVDRYLGLPIYENVLLRASPDSKEYEFGNSNRSRSGITIEQGWLPLYSIAAAFAFARIRPDVDGGRAPSARHNSKDLRKRTIVPRLPSIFFSALFLLFIYQLGRTISGNDTAWSVLMVVASAQPLVWFGWHAGGSSATLAIASVSGLAVWNLARRVTWRDSIVAGLAFVLLFHTDRLSFMILSALLLATVRFAPARTRWRSKLLVTGAIATVGIVPWLYWTDFLEAAARTPMAWPLLAFPGDFVWWFAARKAFLGRDRPDHRGGASVGCVPTTLVYTPHHRRRWRPAGLLLHADLVRRRISGIHFSKPRHKLCRHPSHVGPGRAWLSAVRTVPSGGCQNRVTQILDRDGAPCSPGLSRHQRSRGLHTFISSGRARP